MSGTTWDRPSRYGAECQRRSPTPCSCAGAVPAGSTVTIVRSAALFRADAARAVRRLIGAVGRDEGEIGLLAGLHMAPRRRGRGLRPVSRGRGRRRALLAQAACAEARLVSTVLG